MDKQEAPMSMDVVQRVYAVMKPFLTPLAAEGFEAGMARAEAHSLRQDKAATDQRVAALEAEVSRLRADELGSQLDALPTSNGTVEATAK